jgi:hypothetical protein
MALRRRLPDRARCVIGNFVRQGGQPDTPRPTGRAVSPSRSGKERQPAVFCRKFSDELSHRRRRGRELTEIPYLAATDTIGNCYCITQF